MLTITISGTDGSGKSTQVDRLTEHFLRAGKRVYYFHAIQFSVANRLRSGSRKSVAPGERAAVTSADASTILLRKVFLRIDIVRFRRLMGRLDREGWDVLVSDRYFYDNLVNVAYLESASSSASATSGALRRVLLAPAPPKPTHAFYLRVDAGEIMARPRPPEQGLEYLVAKSALYDELAARLGITVVDGCRSADEVSETLIDLIAGGEE